MVKNKEFAATAFDPDDKIFIVYIAFFANYNLSINFYLFYRAQIALLIVYKSLTAIPSKYADFANVFSPDFANKLSKYTRINNYLIDIVKEKF